MNRTHAIAFLAAHRDTLGNGLFWMSPELRATLTTQDVAAIKENHYRAGADVNEVLAAGVAA